MHWRLARDLGLRLSKDRQDITHNGRSGGSVGGSCKLDMRDPLSRINDSKLISCLSLQLWSLVPVEKRDEYLSKEKGDTAPVLDLLPLGYSKVLGKGRIPDIPMVVRARFFSREAERKIKEAGGVVELVA